MGEQLPILKGILKGNFSYHNARKLNSKLDSNGTQHFLDTSDRIVNFYSNHWKRQAKWERQNVYVANK